MAQDGALSSDEIAFLKEFPRLKAQLLTAIEKRRAIADDIDKAHKNLTQTSLLTNSLGVVSGSMTVLGLALAPVTAGGSLMLSAAGQGLGMVAGAAGLLTGMLGYRHKKQAQAQVSRELLALDQKVKEAVSSSNEATTYATEVGSTLLKCGRAIKGIKKNIRALEIARAYPHLAEAAENLVLTGRASARTARRVQRAFRGTPLAMGLGSIVKNSVLSSLFLGLDLKGLLKDWDELQQGSKTELASLLRAEAEELEEELAELTRFYESLQERARRKGSGSSSSKGAVATLTKPPAHQGKAGRWAPAIAG